MTLSKDLLRVENRLREVLEPIRPRHEFVQELRSRLDQEMVKKVKNKKMQTGLLVAGGIVGLAVMVISLIRSLTTWDKKFQNITKSLPKIRKREPVASI
ncbi:MAG: hypothetical protein MUP11_12460 [Anaerolineales bacterium]|nr:hypothetical protein [Anaerolineales bacterium]